MDSCLICLEETDQFFIPESCNCKIYGHSECIEEYFNVSEHKCIICKKPFHENIKNDRCIDKLLGFLRILDNINCDLISFIVLSFLLTIFLIVPIAITIYFINKWKKYKNNVLNKLRIYKIT